MVVTGLLWMPVMATKSPDEHVQNCLRFAFIEIASLAFALRGHPIPACLAAEPVAHGTAQSCSFRIVIYDDYTVGPC